MSLLEYCDRLLYFVKVKLANLKLGGYLTDYKIVNNFLPMSPKKIRYTLSDSTKALLFF